METTLRLFQNKIDQFAAVVDCFADSVEPPHMHSSGPLHQGFRYAKPTAKHFCLIKVARLVSGLNAAMVLAGQGYNQEMCVLMRTVIECTTHIEFVLSGLENGELKPQQQKYLNTFFDDFERNSSDDFKKPSVRQEKVHKEISQYLDAINGEVFKGRSSADMMWSVYANFSNYVHARYPEAMDLFGGEPAHFHTKGMLDTPKDNESLEILEMFIHSAGLCLILMIQKFVMKEQISVKPELAGWIIQE